MGKRIMNVELGLLPWRVLNLGYVGENEHTQIVIDCTEVLLDYPQATCSMVVKPPRGDLYPVMPTKSGNTFIWEITASDVVYAGSGQIQLTFYNGEEIIRSDIGSTKVAASLETTGDAPEPLQNWMDAAEETARQIAEDAAEGVVDDLADAKDEAIAAIEAKGQEVIEDIPADYSELSDDVEDLKNAIESFDGGTTGQILRKHSNTDLDVEWVNAETPTDTQVQNAVDNWLVDHPEATTTVQDDSITDAKLAQTGGILDRVKILGQNSVFTELYNARYVGHMGFSGWIKDTTAKPAVQKNSLMALDLAASLGIRFVETDTTILSDGTWVISHDLNTQNLSGDSANLVSITLADYKSRKVIKEYLTSGSYWTYAESEQYTPLTLEEFLLHAKKLGLYVLPEVKWLDSGFTDTNWQAFANVVKSCGMENSIIIYTAHPEYMAGMAQYLPHTPVCNSQINATNADYIISTLKNYPMAMACTGEASYSTILSKCKEANIPLGLWVTDDYTPATTFLTDGGTFIVTDCLIDKFSAENFCLFDSYGTSEFYVQASKYPGSETAEIADGIITLTTDDYVTKYFNNYPVQSGDIVVLSAKVKTSGVGDVRVYITNTKSGTNRRTVTRKSTSTCWEELNVIYICGKDDTVVSPTLDFHSANSVESSAQFTDVVMKHYSNADPDAWKDLTYMSYRKKDGVVTVTRKSHMSISASTDTAVGQLPIGYRPSRTLTFAVSVGPDGGQSGFMTIDQWGNVKIKTPQSVSAEFYTVSF